MNTQLLSLVGEVEDVKAVARRFASTVGDDEWDKRPPKGGWSVAECLTHLNITAREMLPAAREAMAAGWRDGVTGDGPYRHSLAGALLCWFLEPPYRMRFKTGTMFDPAKIEPKAQVLAEFERLRDDLIECIRKADGLNLTRLRIVSPFDRRVKYNLYTTFRILPTHDRRHLWQAKRVLAALRTPARAMS